MAFPVPTTLHYFGHFEPTEISEDNLSPDRGKSATFRLGKKRSRTFLCGFSAPILQPRVRELAWAHNVVEVPARRAVHVLSRLN